LAESIDLFEKGYKEITLLGQNVDSYYWVDETNDTTITFAALLEKIALISPFLRLRFSTSHPKDITDDVLHTIAKYENICNYIHLPVQSGNNRILQLMNRTYTREWYLAKVKRIREIIPDCGLSTDIIAGFCTETEEEHQETISIMNESVFDYAYMYYYSERPGTLAERRYTDDVPEEVKKRRLQEIVDAQYQLSLRSNQNDVGKTYRILIDGESKKDPNFWKGRNDQNKVAVFPKADLNLQMGNYVDVQIHSCTKGTLLGTAVPKTKH
jgi:tRNA-2-methylthio-N6-dimethylallyladenosine synthase